MPDELISEEIEVRFEHKPGPPTSFLWRGLEHRIAEVEWVRRFIDRRAAWWQRRHRDYYRVRTSDGHRYELYHHRGPIRKRWVLYKRLAEDNDTSPSGS